MDYVSDTLNIPEDAGLFRVNVDGEAETGLGPADHDRAW